MKNTYKAITASAGSGKTYTLVQKLLLICLAEPYKHTVIQNILALTFTNKAANEMKERILGWLHSFTQCNYQENKDLAGIQQALKDLGKEIHIDELHRRAKLLRDFILHNYSVLNIGTIDKFNAKLVRNFAYELGLAKNFNLEINPEPFLIEAVDQMLDKVGEDANLSQEFIDFVMYNLDNEKKINLSKELLDNAKKYLNDVHHEYLQQNTHFESEEYQKANVKLKKSIQQLQKDIHQLASKAVTLVKNNGLENSDFFGGGNRSLLYFFDTILLKNEVQLRDSPEDEEKKLESYRKGASTKAQKAGKESTVLSLIEPLISLRENIIQKQVQKMKEEKLLRALLPLKVNQNIRHELHTIENENDLVLLSKFNVLIHENLQKEPAEFIYEKVGTKFQHFFLDEFQDTSYLQWKNMLPLRNESLSQENTSFTIVGDPKQSIYRFRGGDSRIMIDILQHKEQSPLPATIETLNKNWRSASHIVEFNNQLYEWISHTLQEEHQNIFGEKAKQIPQSSKKGRVKIHLLDKNTKPIFYQESAQKMHRDIQECLDNGYQMKDITILCRGNDDIYEYISLLSQMNVHYHGTEHPLKTISESGLTLNVSQTLLALIHFLKWKTNPKNEQDFALMLYHLQEIGRISLQDFTEEVTKILRIQSPTERLSFLQQNLQLNLSEKENQHFNLYNSIEYLLQNMAVENVETDFILSFLEAVYAFTQNPGATRKQLIKLWEENISKQTLQTSDHLDAVQLMTIHKAKGLEFPVVFLPMLNSNYDGKFSDWFETQSLDGLSSINIDAFTKELATYDEEVKNFNEKNTYLNRIDRLSIQYVATTRPVDQLILYLQKSSKKESQTLEILDFIEEKCKDYIADEFDFYPEYEAQKTTAQHTHTQNTVALAKFSHDNSPTTNIKIATPSRSYQQRDERVRMGIFLHELLATIHSPADVDFAVEKYILNGTLQEYEALDIKQKLHETITRHAEYFSDAYQSLNERELMLHTPTETHILRPDKILRNANGEYLIIDFKTGNPDEKHEKQMELYRKAMENAGHTVIGTKLVFVRP